MRRYRGVVAEAVAEAEASLRIRSERVDVAGQGDEKRWHAAVGHGVRLLALPVVQQGREEGLPLGGKEQGGPLRLGGCFHVTLDGLLSDDRVE